MSTDLQPRNGTESSLCVLHVTDNHLTVDPGRERRGIKSAETFQSVVETATRKHTPDLLLLTGDIADDCVDVVYETFLSTLDRSTSCPKISTPGNHDLAEPFWRHLSGESLTVGTWRVMSVDTHVDNEVAGSVSSQEMDRVREELAANGSPTLVIGHHPTTDVGAAWIDAHRIRNGDELLSLFWDFPHVKSYVCGHIHQEFDQSSRNVRLLATPSTCWQFKTNSEVFAFDDLSPGWRWLWLHPDGTLDTTVERLDAKNSSAS